MSRTPSAYVDTNILVSYALGEEKDERFHVVEKFFADVLKGQYIVVISHFVLSETLHTLRNIATNQVYKELKNQCSQDDLIKLVNSSNFRNDVNDRSMKAFKIIIDIITRDPDHFKLEEYEVPYSEKMFEDGLKILSEVFGDFRVYRYRCPKCEAYLGCDTCGFDCEVVYKAINAPDVTHALISSYLLCDYFFTMDKYFSKIPENRVKSKIVILA